ncbi:lysozyme family protein [Bacillus tropicus]|uniref:bifunctional lytic transglycosylase/C40 family peptidase n=1 Tax=Bacillus tropicus TaxID=2026188 RepID=UPI00399CC088
MQSSQSQIMVEQEIVKHVQKKQKKKKGWKIKLIVILISLAALMITVAGVGLVTVLMLDDEKPTTPGGVGGIGGIGTATVSPEVLKWEPLVRKHAQSFGMEPFVPLALALIQQESGGTLIDVMQSAEGAFNTRYPRIQNGITDPDYSIWCGIQELKHSLELAGVSGPADIEKIKLALQTYNFGPGFINFIQRNGGAYTLELAKQFALEHNGGRTQCGFRSPYCYGDFSYVEKVLKHYVVNAGGGGAGPGDGTGDGPANVKFNEIMALVSPYDGYPYVFGGRAPPYFDCSGLVEWSYNKLGIRISGTAEDMYNQTVPVDKPAPGDLVFFQGTYKPGISHIGIYIGNNKMFNAGGTHLHYADLSKPYWVEHFSGIRRVK